LFFFCFYYYQYFLGDFIFGGADRVECVCVASVYI
jgi:hypothetical protein